MIVEIKRVPRSVLMLLQQTRGAILWVILQLSVHKIANSTSKLTSRSIKMSICYKMDPFIEIVIRFCDCDGTSTCKE